MQVDRLDNPCMATNEKPFHFSGMNKINKSLLASIRNCKIWPTIMATCNVSPFHRFTPCLLMCSNVRWLICRTEVRRDQTLSWLWSIKCPVEISIKVFTFENLKPRSSNSATTEVKRQYFVLFACSILKAKRLAWIKKSKDFYTNSSYGVKERW